MDTIQGYLSYYYFGWERWVEDYCSLLKQQKKQEAQISKGEISVLVALLLAEAGNME